MVRVTSDIWHGSFTILAEHNLDMFIEIKEIMPKNEMVKIVKMKSHWNHTEITEIVNQ